MTTPPILSDTEIEARIASVACSLSVPLTQADIAWIAENVRRWLKTYMFSENSLSGRPYKKGRIVRQGFRYRIRKPFLLVSSAILSRTNKQSAKGFVKPSADP